MEILIGLELYQAETPPEVVDPLKSGFINYGCASDRTGMAYSDLSDGERYGRRNRFEHEEDRFITKIPSKNKR